MDTDTILREAFEPLAQHFVQASTSIHKVIKQNKPIIDRIRRHLKRQERIRHAEVKAARKARRQKPRLYLQ